MLCLKDPTIARTNKDSFLKSLASVTLDPSYTIVVLHQYHTFYDPNVQKFYRSPLFSKQVSYLSTEEEGYLLRDVALGLAKLKLIDNTTQRYIKVWTGINNVADRIVFPPETEVTDEDKATYARVMLGKKPHEIAALVQNPFELYNARPSHHY